MDCIKKRRISKDETPLLNIVEDIEKANKSTDISSPLKEVTHSSIKPFIADRIRKRRISIDETPILNAVEDKEANKPTEISTTLKEITHTSDKPIIVHRIRKRKISIDETPLLSAVEDQQKANKPTEIPNTLKEIAHASDKHLIVDPVRKRKISTDETPLLNTVEDQEKANKPTEISYTLKERNRKKKRKNFDPTGNTRNATAAVEDEENKKLVRAQKKRIQEYEEGIATFVVSLCRGMKENVFNYMVEARDNSTWLTYLPKIKNLGGPLKKLKAAVQEVKDLNKGLESKEVVEVNPLENMDNLITLITYLRCQAVTNITEEMVYRNINTKVLLQYNDMYRTERLEKLRQVYIAKNVFENKVYKFKRLVKEAVEYCVQEIRDVKEKVSSPLLKPLLKRTAFGSEENSWAPVARTKMQKKGYSSSYPESSEECEPQNKNNLTTNLDSVFKPLLLKNESKDSGKSSPEIYRSSDAKEDATEGSCDSSNPLRVIMKLQGGIRGNLDQGTENEKLKENKSIILYRNSANLSKTHISQITTQNNELRGFGKECHSKEDFNPRGLKRERDPGYMEQNYNPRDPKMECHPKDLSHVCDPKDLKQQYDAYEKFTHDLKAQCKPHNLDNQCDPGNLTNCNPENLKTDRDPHSLKNNSDPQSQESVLDPKTLHDICNDLKNIWNSQNLKNDCGLQTLDSYTDSKIIINLCESLKNSLEPQRLSDSLKPQRTSNNLNAYDPLEGCSHHHSDIKLESSTGPTKQASEELGNTENQSQREIQIDHDSLSNSSEVPMELNCQHELCKSLGYRLNLNGDLCCEAENLVKSKKGSKTKVKISDRLLALDYLNEDLLRIAFEMSDHYHTLEREFYKMEALCTQYVKSEKLPILLLQEFLYKRIPNLFKKS